MTPAVPLDPFAELLRQSPRGSAVLLATGAQARLREAPTLTLAFLKTLLLTMIIPAEALARRIILALAAGLRMRASPEKTTPATAQSRPAPAPPNAPSVQGVPRAAPFRMQEKLPPVQKPVTLRTETILTPAGPGAQPALSPEEKLLNTIWSRLGAVLRALHDPDAEALRFLRRHRARKGRVRPPLAFGAPPGLKSADPQLAACLRGSDRDAEAAWTRLCDTS